MQIKASVGICETELWLPRPRASLAMPFSQHDWAIAEMHRLLTSTRKMLDADVIKASVRRSSMLLRAADVLSNVMQDPRIPESLRAYLSDKIRDDAPKDAAATARVVAWLDANAHELNKCKSDLARLTAVTQVVGPSPDEEATVEMENVGLPARRLVESGGQGYI